MKENKEQEILQAAERLFADKGFKASTTTLIATEAGVTHAMLHYYFRTKEHIFLRVFDSYVKSILSELRAVMAPDVYDAGPIRKVTELCFDFFNEHRGQMSLILEVARERPDILETYVSEIKNYLGSSYSSHRDRIEKAVKEGRIAPITFNELLMDIISICSAPFFFDPVISNVIKLDEKQKAALLARRREEAVELIANRLTIK